MNREVNNTEFSHGGLEKEKEKEKEKKKKKKKKT